MQNLIKHFSYLIDDVTTLDKDAFKKLCFNNTSELLNTYLKFLFDCDYLMWIYKVKDKYNFRMISERVCDFKFEQSKFSFTQTLESWNESNTVKYNGITIGEFQVHKKRNSLKFRFDMKRLLDLLDERNSR